MDEPTGGGIFSKIVVAIFILALADLIFVNWWLLNKQSPAVVQVQEQAAASDTAGNSPVAQTEPVRESVNSKLPDEVKIEPSPTPAAVKTTSETVVVQTQNKEIFIPLGSGQTTSTSFSDLAGLEVSIDTDKYGAIESVTFEASIWVEGGNGRAWAQIKNVSDNNPFIESQISNPTSTPTLKVSGKIPLPTGSKTYRVQAKTELEQYPSHIENARLKIVLK